LSEHLHVGSELIGVDHKKVEKVVVHDRIQFVLSDILDFVRESTKNVNCVFLSGMLPLFEPAAQKEILAWIMRSADVVFIREVPRVATMIDLFFESELSSWRGYRLLEFDELVSLLNSVGLRIMEHHRCFDMYILADNSRASRN
ncbi:MAG: hypothetical protein P8Y36_10555, partial [Alphaproteobacteria bacterium]